VIVYLDTSSLAKLYIAEPGTDEVLALVQQAAVVATSQVAYPELRAALARRRRERTLRPADFAAAKAAFEADWPRYAVTEVTPGICREAGDLAERYRLRGFDSLHLASFADIVRGARGADVRFSSFDTALNRAARALARRLGSEARSQ
jgi:predicted nucleic acid-binding protein